MSEEYLKPCPLCNKLDVEIKTIKNGYRIECSPCEMSIQSNSKKLTLAENKLLVVSKWNKRVLPDKLGEIVSELLTSDTRKEEVIKLLRESNDFYRQPSNWVYFKSPSGCKKALEIYRKVKDFEASNQKNLVTPSTYKLAQKIISNIKKSNQVKNYEE